MRKSGPNNTDKDKILPSLSSKIESKYVKINSNTPPSPNKSPKTFRNSLKFSNFATDFAHTRKRANKNNSLTAP